MVDLEQVPQKLKKTESQVKSVYAALMLKLGLRDYLADIT